MSALIGPIPVNVHLLIDVSFVFAIITPGTKTVQSALPLSTSFLPLTLNQECSCPCNSPFPTIQDVAENGCSAMPEDSLPQTAPSPLAKRENRRPITDHFGQVSGAGTILLSGYLQSAPEALHTPPLWGLWVAVCVNPSSLGLCLYSVGARGG